MSMIREYLPDDLAEAEYLEAHINAADCIDHLGRTKDGLVQIGERDFVQDLEFYITLWDEVIIPDRVYQVLSSEDLQGLVFKPAEVLPGKGGRADGPNYRYRRRDLPYESGPWWELTSDVRLPALSPVMTLYDQKGNRLERGKEVPGCFAREGLYSHAELHYLRSDIERMEPFDAALPCEPFAGPSLVVSKRFYEVCEAHGFAGHWVPVRIDDE